MRERPGRAVAPLSGPSGPTLPEGRVNFKQFETPRDRFFATRSSRRIGARIVVFRSAKERTCSPKPALFRGAKGDYDTDSSGLRWALTNVVTNSS